MVEQTGTHMFHSGGPWVLCTLPPHVGKPLPTYVGPAFPGASSCLKHPTDRQACLCRVADRRLVVTGSALLDAHVSLPRWWRVSYAPARPTQDGAGPRRRPSACPRVGLLPKFRSRSIARGKGRLPTRVESPTAPRGGRDLWVSPLAPLAAQGHRRHYAFISRAAGPPSRRWVAGAVAKGLEEEDAAHVQITFTLS